MQMRISIITGLLIVGLSLATPWLAQRASAETYVAGTAGGNFADRIHSIAGTGSQAGVPDLNPPPIPTLTFKTRSSTVPSLAIFPDTVGLVWNRGRSLEYTPHIKQLDDDPGIHMRDQAFGELGGFSGNYRAQYVLAGLSYHF